MKQLAFRSFYKTCERIRNPSLGETYKLLKESEKWSRDKLAAYQLGRLSDLLNFAYKHSTFYRKRLSQGGYSPGELTSFDILKSIEPLPKDVLREQKDHIHTISSASFSKLRIAETSGSTGQPLMFWRDESWDSWNRASMFRGMSWHEVYPWDRNGYFWGYNIDPKAAWKVKLLDALQNRFRLFSYSDEELNHFIENLSEAKFLQGYSSMIYEVAKIINSNDIGLPPLNLKLVKGTSEKIYDHYHAESEKAFGKRIVSEYGAAETGIIAFECPAGSMHLNVESCIVEEVDNELLVTNLNSYSFPVIRYRLGDTIKLADKNHVCSCGMQHPVLIEVTGRVGKKVYGVNKTYPSLTFYYVTKNIYLQKGIPVDCQFVQKEKGFISILIESSSGPEIAALINEQMLSYFGDDMKWTIVPDSVIHSKKGKRKDFISELD